jgi:hypothetical protein
MVFVEPGSAPAVPKFVPVKPAAFDPAKGSGFLVESNFDKILDLAGFVAYYPKLEH